MVYLVYIGLLACGVLHAQLLALRPLYRLSRRIMDRLMSDVERSDDCLDARRVEIYRAALDGMPGRSGD